MPAGLQLTNSSGFGLIDEDFVGYRVIAEGTAANEFYDTFITYPNTGVMPVVVILPGADTSKTYFGARVSPTATEMSVNPARVWWIPPEEPMMYFQYKVLIPLASNAASGLTSGMQVFTSSGALAFDAGHSIFRVQGAFNVVPTGQNFTFDLPVSSSPYWFTLNSTRTFDNYYDMSTGRWQERGLALGKNTENQMRLQMIFTRGFPDPWGLKGTPWTSSGIPLTVLFGTF
jgi:hypothetical protein